jgi:alcohol dehydrogenase class IV
MYLQDLSEILFLPQKTILKKDAFLGLGEELLEFGKRGLIVHGTSFTKSGRKDKLSASFPTKLEADFFCRGSGEPTLSEISQVIKKAKSIKAEWIAGIGGGSVLDLAKASAGLFNAKKPPVFYQEGGKLTEKGIPFIAVPTTCGTGSEATPNAVIINAQKKTKLSIRNVRFLARTVILDVGLLQSIPRTVLVYSAMDALVQSYESFVSRGANWFSESLALKAIELIDKNIVPAFQKQNQENLSELLVASYFSGLAFSSSRLGVIHGIAHPLGALYNLPHGLICAACFIPSIRLNREVMGEKYKIISGILGRDFIKRVQTLLDIFNISSPFSGKTILEKEKIIKEAIESGSTAANPKKINREDIEFILNEIF